MLVHACGPAFFGSHSLGWSYADTGSQPPPQEPLHTPRANQKDEGKEAIATPAPAQATPVNSAKKEAKELQQTPMPPKKLEMDAAATPVPMSVEKESPGKWGSPQPAYYRRWEQNNWWGWGGWDGWDSWSGSWGWEDTRTSSPAQTIRSNSDASTHASDVVATLGRQRTSLQELDRIAEEAADFQAKLEKAVEQLEKEKLQEKMHSLDTQTTLAYESQELQAIADSFRPATKLGDAHPDTAAETQQTQQPQLQEAQQTQPPQLQQTTGSPAATQEGGIGDAPQQNMQKQTAGSVAATQEGGTKQEAPQQNLAEDVDKQQKQTTGSAVATQEGGTKQEAPQQNTAEDVNMQQPQQKQATTGSAAATQEGGTKQEAPQQNTAEDVNLQQPQQKQATETQQQAQPTEPNSTESKQSDDNQSTTSVLSNATTLQLAPITPKGEAKQTQQPHNSQTTGSSAPTREPPAAAPAEDNAWRCDKYGVPLKPKALYSRFYRSCRGRGATGSLSPVYSKVDLTFRSLARQNRARGGEESFGRSSCCQPPGNQVIYIYILYTCTSIGSEDA